jgi:16S rRNA (cytidine1402-2'-O)-methyltransferase
MKKSIGKLFLIPQPLAEDALATIPPVTLAELVRLRTFVVENIKPARRYIVAARKAAGDWAGDMEDYRFFDSREEHDRNEALQLLYQGTEIGLLSDAGAPGVADPGTQLTSLALGAGVELVPLPGPSSLLLALMGSGMNGQSFSFHGYLPRKPQERKAALRKLDHLVLTTGATQLFIETPYRNNAMLQDILKPATLPRACA